MPKVFDNIETHLLPTLKRGLSASASADFCVGYFNLRGWRNLADHIEHWSGGDGNCCRLLVGMQQTPHDDLRTAYKNLLLEDGAVPPLDQRRASELKREIAQQFRDQLVKGAPTNADEAGLRQLVRQILEEKVVVKLYLRHQLHAKLYLLSKPDDSIHPRFGYVGSSNLTFSGLQKQGELNVDVLEQDACEKLQAWFDARWNDRFCVDISDELVEIIEESWAREDLIPPHHIYLKMAYHLSREAREGLASFEIPSDIQGRLFDFQAAAVRIAANLLNKRGGVLIGDVVGLGKTLMATALARIFEEDFGVSTLIICPPNLEEMWNQYALDYGLRHAIVPISQVQNRLSDIPARFRLVLIDESQNLRNPEGQRYQAIKQYINESGSRCILLSATPYNKSFLDLSAQLRLFLDPEQDLGIRPERLIDELGETGFYQRYQVPIRSLAAFERSEYPDDWRELMRLFMVRRTRGFIRDNYAETDAENGRRYLLMADGVRSYFTDRVPRTIRFKLDEDDTADQYARLYSAEVVDSINSLYLPRYGLGNYVLEERLAPRGPAQKDIIDGLNRAGKRLMGFCRTNLFKRLESGGPAFLQSVERHILRNYVFLHALETGQPLPIGGLDALLYDPQTADEDADAASRGGLEQDEAGDEQLDDIVTLRNVEAFQRSAGQVYDFYRGRQSIRHRWLESALLHEDLRRHLEYDNKLLLSILEHAGQWDPDRDNKLAALLELVQKEHPHDKVLVFTQFADTVRYLDQQLRANGVAELETVTGESADPTGAAHRFSPRSNGRAHIFGPDRETRVLVATDVLSEGQNLQDAHVIVNFDLPWAIIRLIQRAGRIDRIGQEAEKILCYSFLPADGVEQIINLRGRVRQRLKENAEVVGTDEQFFEDEQEDARAGRSLLHDLYHERSGILDGQEDDSEVDLASQALQIWKNATDDDAALAEKIIQMPDVVYSSKPFRATPDEPPGALVYVMTEAGTDALAWVDRQGNSVTESQLRILQAAECKPETPALPRADEHHEIVRKAANDIASEQSAVGGQLGRPSSARYRVYHRLVGYMQMNSGTLFANRDELQRAVQEIYSSPLLQSATNTLNRQLRAGIEDMELVDLVCRLYREGRLAHVADGDSALRMEPRIICSLGLIADDEG